MELVERQQTEIEFWKTSDFENPKEFTLENLTNKMNEARVFLDLIKANKKLFERKNRVLELGGGQGWASCMLKQKYPQLDVTLTDISPYAIKSSHYWEYIFQVELDDKQVGKSSHVPLADHSYDVIFCFAAAHHFAEHKKTLKEIKRLLKPGGLAIYFYEPVCPNFIHPLAHWRVNRKRPEVPEDVIRIGTFQELVDEAGLDLDLEFYPSLVARGAFEGIYFRILKLFPFLRHLLPSTANLYLKVPA